MFGVSVRQHNALADAQEVCYFHVQAFLRYDGKNLYHEA